MPPLPAALQCPAHSHYSVCTRSCQGSCAALAGLMQCASQCFEGCECDDRFLLSQGVCIPAHDCGCTHNGQYMPVSRGVGLPAAVWVEGLEGHAELLCSGFLFKDWDPGPPPALSCGRSTGSAQALSSPGFWRPELKDQAHHTSIEVMEGGPCLKSIRGDSGPCPSHPLVASASSWRGHTTPGSTMASLCGTTSPRVVLL